MIVVVGEGFRFGVPDRCLLSFALHVMSDSAAEALASAAELADVVIRTVRDAGVESADVRTENVTVQDWYHQQQQRVTGRVATHSLIITNRRLDEVSNLLSGITATAGDALRVQAIMLTISDSSALHAAARRDAVEDAKAKATQLAKASGVRLGPLVAIEEGQLLLRHHRDGPSSGRCLAGRHAGGTAPVGGSVRKNPNPPRLSVIAEREFQ